MAELRLEEAEISCLRQVRESDGFVCILDQTYGTPWGDADMSILELEIFMAALCRHPISIFLLAPFEAEPRLRVLLDLVRESFPGAVDETPRTEVDLVERVLRFCDSVTERLRRPRSRGLGAALGYLTQGLALRRAPVFRRQDLDVEFLGGRLAPLNEIRKPALIEHLLTEAESRIAIPEQLVVLWKAIRWLSAADYRDDHFRDLLPLWNRALGLWGSAAAWHGLHGHLYLGRLAAVNTLNLVRARFGGAAPVDFSLQGGFGALASEYYSIAKRVPSLRTKRSLLRSASSHLERGLALQESDRSGLLSIRGSVRLALGYPWAAISDYRKALDLRLAGGEEEGRIGETEVELGFAYLLVLRFGEAGRWMEMGIDHLLTSNRVNFTVRALRKLSLFYRLTLRLRESRETLHRAWELARKGEAGGQLEQIASQLGGELGDR